MVQDGDELLWCCLDSFAYTYWMEMLKTQPGRYFKEVSSDVLLAEYNRGDVSASVL